MIGPTAVGYMIAGGLPSVFWMFASAALFAAIVTAAFAIETKGRVLEEVSPWFRVALVIQGVMQMRQSEISPRGGGCAFCLLTCRYRRASQTELNALM